MEEENGERKENELLALTSIYGEDIFIRDLEGFGGKFYLHLKMPSGFKVVYSLPNTEKVSVLNGIEHLPDITLKFSLPANYPDCSPPVYSISSIWLTSKQVSKLCEALDDAWNTQVGIEVLFTWVQILLEDAIEILNIRTSLVIPSTLSTAFGKCAQDIVSVIADFDSNRKEKIFNESYSSCAVCFVDKIGMECISFSPCKHIFCCECIKSYFEVQIKDGSVRGLTCPESECSSQADQSLIKKLVPPDIYEKYENFLLQSTLDCMDEIVYCPRIVCNAAVLKETEENMGRCPICGYVFCVLCKRTFHGVANCPVSAKELQEMRINYLNGTPAEKEALEKRYGKQRLKTVVEDHFSEMWIEQFAKKCPSCSSSIEKIDGCNKMTCQKCSKNFCWLCKKLLIGDPYKHFSDSSTNCFDKLFQGMIMEDEYLDSDEEDGWVDFGFQ